MRNLSSALALSLALLGCSSQGAPPPASFTTVDSAGVVIVVSSEPAAGDTSLRIDPEPFLRLGSEEEGPELFGFVAQGVLLDGGGLAVTEYSAMEVRVFDSAGGHLRTFGGPGDGPAEFRSFSDLMTFRGDSIAIDDQRLRRSTVVSLATGDFRTIPNRMEGNFAAFGSDAEGRRYFFNPGAGYRPDLEAGLQWDTTDIVAVDPDSGSPTVVTRLASRQQMILPDGNTELIAPAFYSTQAVAPDGFYWGTADRYEIAFYDLDGRLRRLIRRPVEPEAVTPAMIEEYIEANLDRVRRNEGEASVPRYRQRYEEAIYGERTPVFSIAFVDRAQRLWVAAAEWPAVAPAPSTWSVFSPEGAWLGDVSAPADLMILDADEDVVLGVWRDEVDVPYVQLHRLSG